MNTINESHHPISDAGFWEGDIFDYEWKNCVWIAFSVIFHEKITVTIWCMWGKKVIEKYIHGKRRNFLIKNHNPNKALISRLTET